MSVSSAQAEITCRYREEPRFNQWWLCVLVGAVAVINGWATARCLYLANGASRSWFTSTKSFADYWRGVLCASASAWTSKGMVTSKPGRTAGWRIRDTADSEVCAT